MNKEWIEEKLFNVNDNLCSKRCRKRWFEKEGFENEYEDLIQKTKFLGESVKLSERIWYIFRGKENPVECGFEECEQKPTFQSFSMGYLDFCSQSCSQKSEETRNKIKNTCKERYGESYYLKTDEFLEKQKQTVQRKYGVDNVSQAKEIKEKKKATCQENFGVDSPMKSEKVRKKSNDTCLEQYGFENVMENSAVKNQSRSTRLENQYNQIEFENVELLFGANEYEGVYETYQFRCEKCSTEFEDNLTKGETPRCPVCFPNQNTSKAEKEIYYFIDDLVNCEVENNVWGVIGDKELDILVRDEELAIEFDGLYYHSQKNKNYHLNKTKQCRSKEIDLIHIFEDEWKENKSEVKRRLKGNLSEPNKDCREVKPRLFSDGASHMKFDETTKSGEYKITKLEGSSFQETFSAFKKEYDPEFVEVIVDKRWHPNFDINGFELIKKVNPKPWKVENEKRFEVSNPELAENVIWDCGYSRYIYTKN